MVFKKDLMYMMLIQFYILLYILILMSLNDFFYMNKKIKKFYHEKLLS